jgi:hypothetical protein
MVPVKWTARLNQKGNQMQFPGYWVYEDEGKVVLKETTFDETELDPATNWKRAFQSQDPESPSKGYVNESEALACAARLLARRQGVELSDADVAKLLARNSLFEGGKCHLGTLDELRLVAVAANLRGGPVA